MPEDGYYRVDLPTLPDPLRGLRGAKRHLASLFFPDLFLLLNLRCIPQFGGNDCRRIKINLLIMLAITPLDIKILMTCTALVSSSFASSRTLILYGSVIVSSRHCSYSTSLFLFVIGGNFTCKSMSRAEGVMVILP